MLDRRAWATLRRLTRWLDQFRSCFGHRAQVLSLREYIDGLLSDSPRKSMEAMLARVVDPRSYQAFQHFLTHAPWEAATVWRRVLAVLPVRRGVLIVDDTGFPKQGRHSVGVARQYSGTLGKVANCQVAVTAALWDRSRAWLVGAALYLPAAWLTPEARAQARIPARVAFEEKWRLALRLIRRVRAAGITIEAVLADAGYGDCTSFRTALDRMALAYVVGVSSTLTVFLGSPATAPPPPPQERGGRRARFPHLATDTRAQSLEACAGQAPLRTWHRVRYRNGTHPASVADFVALRGCVAVEWRRRHRLVPVWVLCERPVGSPTAQKFFLSNLPADTPLPRLVRLAHQRWAVEQQYQDLKTDLGLDHFEGRSYPGWHHHVVLCAVAYAFLQQERTRDPATVLTFPAVHAIVQEVFTALLFVSRPRYLDWMNQAKQRFFQLRI